MARALIVGCGCHGRTLGRELLERGWQVRGTSRGAGVAEIETAGLEAVAADPNRPGTLLELCGDVAVLVWLLGSAEGTRDELEVVHGSRLERLLEKLVDTPVRGVVYEAAGSVAEPLLGAGRRALEDAGARWSIPFAVLEAPRGEPGWTITAADVVEGVLRRPRTGAD